MKTSFLNPFHTPDFQTQFPVLRHGTTDISKTVKWAISILGLLIISNLGTYFFGLRSGSNSYNPDNALYLMEKASIYVTDVAAFDQKVREVSYDLGVPADWLMAVMYSESRFDANAENFRGSGAVGLIQFMPTTARDMGTSTYKLGQMTHEEQLNWVKAYMNMYRKKYGDYESLTDFYLAILFPKARGQESCYTLYASPSKSYKQNVGLDEDKDGRVTIHDIDKRMRRLYPSAYAKTSVSAHRKLL